MTACPQVLILVFASPIGSHFCRVWHYRQGKKKKKGQIIYSISTTNVRTGLADCDVCCVSGSVSTLLSGSSWTDWQGLSSKHSPNTCRSRLKTRHTLFPSICNLQHCTQHTSALCAGFGTTKAQHKSLTDKPPSFLFFPLFAVVVIYTLNLCFLTVLTVF